MENEQNETALSQAEIGTSRKELTLSWLLYWTQTTVSVAWLNFADQPLDDFAQFQMKFMAMFSLNLQ